MSEQKDQLAIEPLEQENVPFHGQSIIAVRLPDNRICVVLRWVCESLNLAPGRQVSRIQRTAAIANELVRVRVVTPGGIQTMPAITLRGFPVWILGINPNEVKDERLKEMIIAYQVEAVDVLYNHFSKRRLASAESQAIVPAEPTKPTPPQPEAPSSEWISYYQHMIQWHQWKQDMEVWRNETEQWKEETRTEIGEIKTEIRDLKEEVRSILPQFGLATEHRETTRNKVLKISKLEGFDNPGSVWSELNTAFGVTTYKNIPDEKWEQVSKWLQGREKGAQRRAQQREHQRSLFDEP